MIGKKLLTVALVANCFFAVSCSDRAVEESPISTVTAPANDVVEEVAPWEPAALEQRKVTAGGLKREYVLSLPHGARQRDKLPLIFVFHGFTEDIERTRRNTGLDQADAIVAYMAGVNTAWAPAPYASTTGEQDLAYVDAVLEELTAELPVDRSRVFAAGMSNGGGFAAYLGCQRPQEFTGIATVSAAFYERVSQGCSQIPMKHIDFHGTDDRIISYYGGERHATVYDSVPEMLEESARRNHCAAREEDTQITSLVTQLAWSDCDAPLQHYRIEHGPHTWPGGAGDTSATVSAGFATRMMLEFFGVGYGIEDHTTPERQ